MNNKLNKILKKSLGQHFLKNTILAYQITDHVRTTKNDYLLEIGPGNGALTRYLVNKEYKEYHIVELDSKWAKYIKEEFGKTNIIVHEQDILLFELKINEKYTIISNIPYNITYPILQKIVLWYEQIHVVVIMMQEEVAQKLIKKRGADYGPISILMQLFFDITLLEKVEPKEFIPEPKVNSRVVRFTVKEKLFLGKTDMPIFKDFLSLLFVHPRKKIKHQNISEHILKKISIEIQNKRAQELSPESLVNLFFECFI